MATAIVPLRVAQIGVETTPGTLVAATVQLVGSGRLAEVEERYRSTYPRGFRATVGGVGVTTRRATAFTWETEANAEDILWPLSTGILGGVTPTNSGGEYTWEFEPELDTSDLTLDTATIEFVESDGQANHVYAEAGYGMTSRLRLAASAGEIATMSWDMFARGAVYGGSPTAALTPYATREPLVSERSSVYLDASWATLGGSQLSGIVRSIEHEVQTGVTADFTLDGRATLDHSRFSANSVSATLNLTVELDATGASAIVGAWRSNAPVFVRWELAGSTIDSNPRAIRVDGSYRFAGPPSFSEDGDQVLVTANLEAVVDHTSGKILAYTVVNELSSL